MPNRFTVCDMLKKERYRRSETLSGSGKQEWHQLFKSLIFEQVACWKLNRSAFCVFVQSNHERTTNRERTKRKSVFAVRKCHKMSQSRFRWFAAVSLTDISFASLPAPWHKMKQNRGTVFLIHLHSSFSWPHENPNAKLALRLPLIFEQRKSTPSLVWEKMCFLCLCVVLSGQFSQLYDVRLQGCNFLFHDFIFLSLQGQFPALCSP